MVISFLYDFFQHQTQLPKCWGTTEVAIISLNGVVYSESVRIGGDRFDDAIIDYIRKNYGTVIGEATSERIKQEIGTAFPGNKVLEIDVRGRNLAEGVPRSFTINSNEVLEALQDPLSGIQWNPDDINRL